MAEDSPGIAVKQWSLTNALSYVVVAKRARPIRIESTRRLRRDTNPDESEHDRFVGTQKPPSSPEPKRQRHTVVH